MQERFKNVHERRKLLNRSLEREMGILNRFSGDHIVDSASSVSLSFSAAISSAGDSTYTSN